jgi:hypothetical protein
MQSEAMSTNSDNILHIGVMLRQTIPQSPHQRVYRLFANALSNHIGPYSLDYRVARANMPVIDIQQLNKAILRQTQRRINFLIADKYAASFTI